MIRSYWIITRLMPYYRQIMHRAMCTTSAGSHRKFGLTQSVTGSLFLSHYDGYFHQLDCPGETESHVLLDTMQLIRHVKCMG